ncbi:hypothetical protein E4U21_005584 [Claviceps maximensis]|nr:hypothetical protein E4U21_005584 [Claviceps maximensis]
MTPRSKGFVGWAYDFPIFLWRVQEARRRRWMDGWMIFRAKAELREREKSRATRRFAMGFEAVRADEATDDGRWATDDEQWSERCRRRLTGVGRGSTGGDGSACAAGANRRRI